ncbi:PucR family transcriptional regulator, partial [Streptomyces sp. CPS1]
MAEHGIPGRYLDGFVPILTEVAATGRRLTREEIKARRTLGEQAAEAGLGLR